jgi:hypothetical protein
MSLVFFDSFRKETVMTRIGFRIATLAVAAFLLLAGSARALTISGTNSFRVLAPSGTLTVTGDLTLAAGASINCNDNATDQPPGPVASGASACNIKIVVTGDMEMQAGSAIFAENRNGGGNGGNIDITVGGTLTMRGPAGSGAVISSSKTAGAGDTGDAGKITILAGNFGAVTGGIVMEPGSKVLADGPGDAGDIVMRGAKDIDIDGLVESRGSTTVGHGGRITIVAGCTLTVTNEGKISSRGQDPGADLVHLEAGCEVTIYGLVESTGPGHTGAPNSCNLHGDRPPTSAACVEVWSGGTLTIDSRPPHNGEINADVALSGGPTGRGWIDLYAIGAISLFGDTTGPFVAHANTILGSSTGGIITVKSVGDTATSTVSASGRALQASAPAAGGHGGEIVVQATQFVNLDTADLEAKGTASGGKISVRSFQSTVSWQNGIGDVRLNATGTIDLKSCVAVSVLDPIPTGGTAFNGEVPTKTTGVCGDKFPDRGFVLLPECPPECLPTIPQCPTCDDFTVVVDHDVTVNFNPPTPTCNDGHAVGDPNSLCFYFSPNKIGGSTADKWLAVFDLGLKQLLVKAPNTITTTTVGGRAPGIEIKSCTLNVELGAYILVTSVNQNAGPILIKVFRDITINGKVKDSVTGTNGLPGDIVISSCCGNVVTGPKSDIETEGVDPGGSDIDIATCCQNVVGDITINGLVFAHAHAHVPGTPRPDIHVASFNGSVTINSGTAPVFDDFTIAGGRFDLFAGLLSLVESAPLPGKVTVQALKDVLVIGHGNDTTGTVNTSFAAVAAGTLTNSSIGGWVDVRSLTGMITGTDRAFQSFGRNHTTAFSLIQLWAAGNIDLSRPGATSDFNPVVDSSGNIKGGTNVIRSFAGTIWVHTGALVTALVGGTNAETSCSGVTNDGTVTPAPAISTDCTPPAPEPLYLNCENLDSRIGECVCLVQ